MSSSHHPILKGIAILLATVVVLMCLTIAAMPTLLSTAWGRDKMVNWINDSIPGTVTIDELQVGWFSGIDIAGVTLEDPEGRTVLALERLSSDTLPHRFFSGTPALSNTHIQGLKATLTQDTSGVTNLHRAMGKLPDDPLPHHDKEARGENVKSIFTLKLPFTGLVTLTQGSLTWSGPEMEPLEVTALDASLQIPSIRGPCQLLLQGQSQQGDLRGDFHVKGSIQGFNSKGKLTFQRNSDGWPLPLGEGKAQIDVTVKQLAVDVLDRLLTINHPHYTGALTEAIGPALDLNLKQNLSRQGMAVALNANSRNLQVRLHTQSNDNKVVLKEPGQFTWTITPKLAAHFLPLAESPAEPLLLLNAPISLQATLERLEFTPTQSKEEALASALRLRWSIPEAQVALANPLGLLKLQKASGVIERLSATQDLLTHAQTELQYGGQIATVKMEGKWSDLVNRTGDMTVQMRDVPTGLLDALVSTPNLFTALLGETFDTDLSLDTGPERTLAEMKVGSSSQQVTIPSLQLAITDVITLRQPTQVHLSLTPEIVGALRPNTHIGLQDATPVLIALNRLQWPLDGSGFAVDVDVSAAPFLVTNLLERGVGQARVSNFKLKLASEQANELHYQIKANVAPDGTTPRLIALLGKASAIDLAGKMALRDRTVNSHVIDLALNSDLLDLRAKAAIRDNARLELLNPAALQYTLQPTALTAMGFVSDQLPKLTAPALLDATIDQLVFALDPFQVESLRIAGRGSLESIALHDPNTGTLASLKDLNLTWSFDGPGQQATATVKGTSGMGTQQAGKLEAVAKMSGWGKGGQVDWTKASINTKGSLLQMPVAFAAAALRMADLPTLLGNSLDVYFNATLGQNDQPGRGSAEFSFSGDGLSGGFALQIGDKIEFTRDAAALDWTITPARFAALQRMMTAARPNWALAAPTKLHMAFSDLVFPFEANRTKPWAHASAKASTALDAFTIMHIPTKTKAHFDEVSGDIDSRDIAEALSFHLKALEYRTPDNGASSEISIQGKALKLYQGGQWMDPTVGSLTLDVKGRQVPLALLRATPALDETSAEYLRAFLGDRLSADLHLEKKPANTLVSAQITGAENSRLTLDGLIANERLTLLQPLLIEFTLTPDIGQKILVDLLPIFSTALSSSQMVKLTVDSKGFSAPLRGASAKNVQIQSAALELGRVEFHDSGQLASVVSLLDSSKGSGQGQFSVWFTPIYFSLLDGVFRVERLDALIANQYPIAIWGKVDLPKDKVNIAIGVTAKALRASYGIGNLDPSYMLLLSLTGSTSNASIDRTRAAARITALVAQSQGGPQGLILGGVMDLIGAGFDEKRIPQPTSPIPWKEDDELNPAQISNNKDAINPLKKIQKKIEKGTSQILDLLR